MNHGITHGDTDEPVGDEGDVGNDADVFVAAKDTLDGRSHGVAEGKGHGALHQEGTKNRKVSASVVKMAGGNVIDERRKEVTPTAMMRP